MAQLAKSLTNSLGGTMDVVVAKAIARLETSATRTLTGLSNGLTEAESSLSSTVETQISRVSEDMTAKIEVLREYQEQAAKAVEMTVENFQRQANVVSQTILKELRQATADLKMVRTETRETIEKAMQTSQIVTAEIKSARRQLTIRQWAANLGVVTLTMVIGVLLLSRLNPGWTMTQEQHDALYMGQHVLKEYWTAEPEKRAEIERVLKLKAPASTDSTLRASQ